MKRVYTNLLLLCMCMAITAQSHNNYQHQHQNDSTDLFFRHLDIEEVTITGVTGQTKLKNATAPVSIIRQQELQSSASTNIIDAISHKPGISQITTGSGISKPIIRGLGYNRVVVMSDGVRQEGQQWGDEHGVEVDGSSVGSIEVLKGPASLMYGSDAMAGVVIMHPRPTMAEGTAHADVSTEYQTNNGLFHYSLSTAGNQKGFVWDARFSNKMAHAYKNKYDGYVPGSQFRERAGRLMLGLNKQWGHSRIAWSCYHLTPGIIEGERDEDTGELIFNGSEPKSYTESLPFQHVKHYKLVWDNSLNLSTGTLKAILGYQQNRRQEFEESMDEYELFFRLHTLTYDLRYTTNEWHGWKISTGVGGMLQRSGNHGEEYLIPDYRLFDIGLFATASHDLGESWTISGGLRYDHRRLHGYGLIEEDDMRFEDFCRHFNGVTGSIGAVWHINETLNMRMNIARGFRTPNMSELASNGIHEGSVRYEVGNQHLKAEYSIQADLGLDFSSKYVSTQLALFANHIDNYIFTHRLAQEIEPGYLTYAYTQGDARLLGFEAGIDLHPIHSVHFENTFSYVNARLLNQPKEMRYLPFTPAPRWTSEIKWELMHHSHTTMNHHHATSHPRGHSSRNAVRLNNTYIAANVECYMRQSNIFSADQTETETPGYALFNLSAGTDINIGNRKIASFYVCANNLLNKAYQSHQSRLKYTDMNNITGRHGVYNMGRNIVFKLVLPVDI